MTEIEARQRLQDLPVPPRMQHLPRNKVGYVVPWFVAKIDGEWDFRVLREDYFDAHRFNLCTLCGKPIGANVVFVTGPMCTISRTSAELPNHLECALYAVKACPFLAMPKMHRRENNLPEQYSSAGVMIKRNPGVTALWAPVRGTWKLFSDGRGGVLVNMGDPTMIQWWSQGREATREEVEASIESGYPLLMAEAEKGGPAEVREINRLRTTIEIFMPPYAQG